jgi:hypothetical protein
MQKKFKGKFTMGITLAGIIYPIIRVRNWVKKGSKCVEFNIFPIKLYFRVDYFPTDRSVQSDLL